MRTLLLDKDNAPLNRLALGRIQLDGNCPAEKFETQGYELCLFPLVGDFRCEVNGDQQLTIKGRRKVTERASNILRFPAGENAHIALDVEGYSADILAARYVPMPDFISGTHTPHLHAADIHTHDVGEGCYRRDVTEVPTPDGYRIHCGQTYSDGINGCWSSWPSHAEPEEVARYAEHEEVFWCYTEGYGLINCNGKYVTGEEAKGVRIVAHNTAFVTPLGSHEIVFSPKAESLYVWFYICFLKKTYNKYAHEGVKVYTK